MKANESVLSCGLSFSQCRELNQMWKNKAELNNLKKKTKLNIKSKTFEVNMKLEITSCEFVNMIITLL